MEIVWIEDEMVLSEQPGDPESCSCGEIDWVGVMCEGLVHVSRGKCDYYVDEFGELAILDTFYDASGFKGDYNVVERFDTDANFTIIDRKGNVILDIYEDYEDVSTGWGWNYVEIKKNGLEGVMGLDGEIIIELQSDHIYIFDDIAMLDKDMVFTSIYDLRSGELLKEYDLGMDGMNEGFMTVSNLYSGYYLDSLGEIIFGPFDTVGEFSEGLAKVSMDGMIGFINVEGEFEIPLQYEMDGYAGLHYGFHDGLCGMMKKDAEGNNKYGYINREGEMAIPQIYDYTFRFENGMANAEIGEESYFINTSGEIVVSGHDYYNFAAPGLYYAREDDHVMFYNDTGEKYKLMCKDLTEFYNGRAIALIDDEIVSISIEEIKSKLRTK